MANRRDTILRLSGVVPRHPIHGKFPAVAVNDHGIIMELHQPYITSSIIYYQVGSVNGEKISFTEPYDLDRGRFPKVAINNANRVVEVHEGKLRRHIYYRIGTIEVPRGGNLSCKWEGNKSTQLNNKWGRFPAVAVYENTALITYDRSYGSYKTNYHIGTINDDGTDITWGETTSLFDADVSETSVAMNAEHVVAVGRGWTTFMCLVAAINRPVVRGAAAQNQAHGAAQHVQLGAKKQITFDHFGYNPNICLTADHHIILVWQSFTWRQLRYATGRITRAVAAGNAEERNISFSQTAGRNRSDLGFGYNPAAVTSLNGQHFIEEHESNFSKFRCTLHYRTGSHQHEAEAPHGQGEQHAPQGQPLLPPQPQARLQNGMGMENQPN